MLLNRKLKVQHPRSEVSHLVLYTSRRPLHEPVRAKLQQRDQERDRKLRSPGVALPLSVKSKIAKKTKRPHCPKSNPMSVPLKLKNLPRKPQRGGLEDEHRCQPQTRKVRARRRGGTQQERARLL